MLFKNIFNFYKFYVGTYIMYFAFNNNLIERFELHNYNNFLINRDVIKITFLFFYI